MRLRQAVLVARELEPAVALLRSELGLAEPYRDPGVAEFGLENAVFAIGDCFLEVVSPLREGTAAGRYLERSGGDGGYMLIFDLPDLEGARARAARRGVRVVWQIDLEDISTTHLHPRDMGGAIVSIDSSRPYGSWRWGGPEWTGARASPAPGALLGATLAVAEPEQVAALWGEILGARLAREGELPALELDGARVCFERAGAQDPERLVEIALVPAHEPADGTPSSHARSAELLGVRVRRLPAAAPAQT